MTQLTGSEVNGATNNFVLNVLRITWLVLTGLMLSIFVGGMAGRFRQLNQACDEGLCPFQSLTTVEASRLEAAGFSLNDYASFHLTLETLLALAFLGFATVIFLARFDDWFAILVSFAIMLFGLNFMVEVDGAFIELHPQWQMPYSLLTVMAGVLFVMILYLFPDGRFVPRSTRYAAALFAAVGVIDTLARNMAGIPIPQETYSVPVNVIYLACLIIGLAAQVHRYRKVSNPVQRQQTKWVLYGLIVLITCMFAYTLVVELLPLGAGNIRLLFNTVGFAIMAPVILIFPAAMMFSILRYRLWDIDVVVNRTLVYGILTALLVLLFFVSVTVMQSVLVRLTGQDSQAAIVLSTLLITALFNPLRRRLQRLIDRRFYRRRYDAQRVMDRFAQTARDEVDLEALSTELLGTVRYTVQPEHVSLWLRSNDS